MLTPVIRVFAVAALVLAPSLWSRPATAYPVGPPDGVAANPPYYLDCTLCHADFPVNSGNGSLSLLGPPVFEPGQTYEFTVELQDPGQLRWGFELTAMDQALNPAGTFQITDPLHTQLSQPGGGLPDFVKQTLDGTYTGTPDGPVSWTFEWTAPVAESITFYFAGNAANNDNEMYGDYIYADSLVLSFGPTATEPGTWGQIKNLYR